jgi:hypothetical protein
VKRRRKFRPRKGLTVLSVYDPAYKITIDKSVRPERLFHEKDSGNPGRWWAKSELRRFIPGEFTPKYVSEQIRKEALERAHTSISAASSAQLRAPLPPKLVCKGCGIKFRPPDRRPRKFHSVECERTYAKAKRDAAERPKAESRRTDDRGAPNGMFVGAGYLLENMHGPDSDARKSHQKV